MHAFASFARSSVCRYHFIFRCVLNRFFKLDCDDCVDDTPHRGLMFPSWFHCLDEQHVTIRTVDDQDRVTDGQSGEFAESVLERLESEHMGA